MAVLPIGVQGPWGGGCESQAQDLSDRRHRSRAHAIACFSGQLLAHGLFGALLAAPLYEPLTALTGSLPALIASLGGLLMLARTLQQTASDERTTQGVAPMLVAGLSYQLVAMQWLTSILKPGLDGRLLALAAALLLLQVLPQIGLWMLLRASARRLQRRGWLAGRWAPSLSWPLAWLGWTLLKEPLWIGGQYGALALATLDWPVAQTLLPWCGGPLWEALLWGAAIGFWQLGRWRARLLVLLAMALPWRTPLAVADRGDARPVRLAAIQAGADKDWDLASRDAALAQLHAASRAHPPGTVLVTSEVFLKETPPQPPIGVWADFVRALTEAGQHALIGSVLHRPDPAREEPITLNAVLQYSPTTDGARVAVYGKQRLTPAGETVPWPPLLRPVFRHWVDESLQAEIASAPAALGQPLRVGEQQVGLSICHELAFGTQIAGSARQAGWLLNVSDDRWVPSNSYRLQALALARLRALELAKPLLRVSSGGASVLFDARGRLLGQAPGDDALHWGLQLQPAVRDSFFGRWHAALHGGALAALAAVIGMGLIAGLGNKSEAL